MRNEQEVILSNFQKNFERWIDRNIVIYGIGNNTKIIIENFPQYKIKGLMDAENEGRSIFGKKVLSEEEVRQLNPIIIIVAKDSVVRTIFKRIQKFAAASQISVYDIYGNLMKELKDGYQKDENLAYWHRGIEDLKKEILEYEVISFDLFDTLIGRTILRPEDIFKIVEYENPLPGKYQFYHMRIQSERELSGSPTLEQIYENMQRLFNISEKQKEFLQRAELFWDKKFLYSREKMVELFDYARKTGKKTVLLTDMYYTRQMIEEILYDLGIEGYDEIFVSSEYGCSKSDGGLYKALKREMLYRSEKTLHIGDNPESDIKMAEASGLDARLCFSGYELCLLSSINEILVKTSHLMDKIHLGLVVRELFSDPYVLNDTKGIVEVKDYETLGYCFFAPALLEFVLWLKGEARKDGIERILFPSRDGFLMKKIYEVIADSDDPEAVYFKTSRRAVTVASMSSPEQLREVYKIAFEQRPYKGSFAKMMSKRFGIQIPLSSDQGGEEGDFLKYSSEIVANAIRERENYLNYLHKMGIIPDDGQSEAIVDFVGQGTIQFFLSGLLNRDLKGYYYATTGLPNKMFQLGEECIKSFSGNINCYGDENLFSQYYIFFEPILGDGDGSLLCFDRNLNPIFEENRLDYTKINKIQEGILRYVRDYKELGLREGIHENLPLNSSAVILLKMLFEGRCDVSEDIKNTFINDDFYIGIPHYSLWQ